MRIRIILPIIGDQFNMEVEKEVQQFISPGTVVDIKNLTRGTASIESVYDEAIGSPDIIDKVVEAEKEGIHAVFVDCFGDPGVDAAREMVTIPVVGGFQPAVLTACLLAGRFTVVTVLPSVAPMIRNLCRKMGVESNLTSIRYINTPVLDLIEKGSLLDKLYGELEKAVHRDGAESIVLGCTGMLGLAKGLQEKASQNGVSLPVIDPTATAIGFLELLVRSGITHSKVTFPVPTEKKRCF